jgi:predicted transcriptional regulator
MAITGSSQWRIAELIDVSQPTVHRWLIGTGQPSKPSWDKIMAFAASDPRTIHLAHRYILGLLGNDTQNIMALLNTLLLAKAG